MSVELKPKHLLSSYYVGGIFTASFDPTTALGDRLLLSPLPFRGEAMKANVQLVGIQKKLGACVSFLI